MSTMTLEINELEIHRFEEEFENVAPKAEVHWLLRPELEPPSGPDEDDPAS